MFGRKFLGAALGFLAAAMAPLTLVLAPLGLEPVRRDYAGADDGASSMVRMQSHTGAGGRGAHRRWKKRRAAGIY